MRSLKVKEILKRDILFLNFFFLNLYDIIINKYEIINLYKYFIKGENDYDISRS